MAPIFKKTQVNRLKDVAEWCQEVQSLPVIDSIKDKAATALEALTELAAELAPYTNKR